MRHFNTHLTGKTLAFPKELEMHKAASYEKIGITILPSPQILAPGRVGIGIVGGSRKTPAITAGLIEHIKTVK